MKLGLKITITGMIIRMLQAGVYGSLSRMQPVMNVVLFVLAVILCIGGIIITFFEIPENPIMEIIYLIFQCVFSIGMLVSVAFAASVCDTVLTIFLIYGILQVLLHGDLIYVIYIFW